jgi:SAM-dependent methyltransferase
MNRQFAPATERNRDPIAEVLHPHVAPFTEPVDVLEIASGSGEHAVYFAKRYPRARWQPTDRDADALASIDAWREEQGLENVLPALRLDVEGAWPDGQYDLIFCANMIHIAPWSATLGLMRGAGLTLRPRGVMVTYGPYRVNGQHTSPSNERFEDWLKARNEAYGVRDVDDVANAAAEHGLKLVERIPMPANNFCLRFTK